MNLLDQSMGNIARDIPGATAVLHRFKLDFCCGGAGTLRDAAEKKGLNADVLLADLERLQQRGEHDGHGKALERLDSLTRHYQLPDGACNTWQALYKGLQILRNDLMDHIHLENNVLFTQVDGQQGGVEH